MTSRLFQSSQVLFVRENCSLLTKPSKNCLEAHKLSSTVNNKMPIIAVVAAHRRHNHKQQHAILTKSFLSTKVTPSTMGKVNLCNVQLVHNNNNKPQHIQQQTANFSTSAKNFKSKLSGMFNLSWNRLVNSDHEESRRFYATKGGSRDRPQGNKKTTVKVDEEEMSELIDVDAYRSQLDDLTEQMKDDFAKQLSVRGASG
jgi:hypothetical protein